MKCAKCSSTMKEGGFSTIYYSCPKCDWNTDDEETLELLPLQNQYQHLYSEAPLNFVRRMFRTMISSNKTLRIPRVAPKGKYVTLRVPLSYVIAYDDDVAIVRTKAPFEIFNPDAFGWEML